MSLLENHSSLLPPHPNQGHGETMDSARLENLQHQLIDDVATEWRQASRGEKEEPVGGDEDSEETLTSVLTPLGSDLQLSSGTDGANKIGLG
ncbi:hypothetical protein RRG08_010819 [Elysia crispata]|uniref:Uncharacterized protein n=1 Tax=Elysia crispata TaxID=231223 RepID=A0AAE1DEW6_9GAST|nr:hypothetical protein RRG08_010819 [Elysia crispata]